MKAEQIQVGKFYSLKDGTVVRVEFTYDGLASVWEKDSPESFEVTARQLVAEVPEPARETLAEWVAAKKF